MNNYFETKVSYEKVIENGQQRKVTESHIVQAYTFTEAEANIVEAMKPFISGEFTIADIKRYKVSELFLDGEGDRYYKAKMNFIVYDEKSGTEKKTAVYALVLANDIQSAKDKVDAGMKGTMADYVIADIMETKILDVFLYEKK